MSKDKVEIFEVVAHDGFQNEARFVETADKIKLIDALSQTVLESPAQLAGPGVVGTVPPVGSMAAQFT